MKRKSNRERQAAALAYKAGDYAPRVVARGRGMAAEALISLARESGVYVHESPELVTLLMKINVDQFIPPELYVAVAEILAWFHWLEHGQPNETPSD